MLGSNKELPGYCLVWLEENGALELLCTFRIGWVRTQSWNAVWKISIYFLPCLTLSDTHWFLHMGSPAVHIYSSVWARGQIPSFCWTSQCFFSVRLQLNILYVQPARMCWKVTFGLSGVSMWTQMVYSVSISPYPTADSLGCACGNVILELTTWTCGLYYSSVSDLTHSSIWSETVMLCALRQGAQRIGEGEKSVLWLLSQSAVAPVALGVLWRFLLAI